MAKKRVAKGIREGTATASALIKEEVIAVEVDDDRQVIVQFKDVDEKEVGA